MYNDKKVFLDLDGVILDSEQKVIELKRKNCNLNWDRFFEEIDWDKLLKESNEINNSVEIIRELQTLRREIIVLTKIHTMLEMKSKVNELRNRKIFLPVMFVPPHVKKSQIYLPNNNEILIDDSIKNIYDWIYAGGNGILFSNEKLQNVESVKSLDFLLK